MVSPGDRDWGKAGERENHSAVSGKRKLDCNIGCFIAFFFPVQQRIFSRGGELK